MKRQDGQRSAEWTTGQHPPDPAAAAAPYCLSEPAASEHKPRLLQVLITHVPQRGPVSIPHDLVQFCVIRYEQSLANKRSIPQNESPQRSGQIKGTRSFSHSYAELILN